MKTIITLVILMSSFIAKADPTSAILTVGMMSLGGGKDTIEKPVDRFSLIVEQIDSKIIKNMNKYNKTLSHNVKGFDSQALITYYQNKGYKVKLRDDSLVFDLKEKILVKKKNDDKYFNILLNLYLFFTMTSLLLLILSNVAWNLSYNKKVQSYTDAFANMFYLPPTANGHWDIFFLALLPVGNLFAFFFLSLLFFGGDSQAFFSPHWKES